MSQPCHNTQSDEDHTRKEIYKPIISSTKNQRILNKIFANESKNLRKELHAITMSNLCQGIREESAHTHINQCNSSINLLERKK